MYFLIGSLSNNFTNTSVVCADNTRFSKSSNNSPGAYLQAKIFWVGAYSSRGLFERGAY